MKINDKEEKGGEEGHEFEVVTVKTWGAIQSNPDQ